MGRLASWALLSVAGSLSMMWLAGYFLDMDVSSGGFGYFSMNLLAPFSLVGAGPALPHAPQGATTGQYEGFNYLGLGVLLALAFVMLNAVAARFRDDYGTTKSWRKAPDLALILSCLALTVLAISDEVTFGSHLLFVLPTSAGFASVLNVFRASGRLFWPVYYLLTLAAIRGVSDLSPPICARVLVLVFVIQLVDIFPFFHAVHDASTANAAHTRVPTFTSTFWAQARRRYGDIDVIPGKYANNENIAYESLAAEHEFAIDTAYYARMPAAALREPRQYRHEQFLEGVLDPHALYLIQSSAFEELKEVQRLLPLDTGVGLVDGFTVVAPRWFNNASGNYLHPPEKNNFHEAAFGETYHFGKGGNGVPYMLAGWSDPGDGAT